MKIAKPEKLTEGQIVTVLQWFDKNDQSYIGYILRVRSVDLPFIVADASQKWCRRLQLDTRKVELGYPSEKHVKLIRPAVASVAGEICAE